ncbi:hypothetical protein LTR36_007984 [Oleoguttula mirabilis]|uniref:Enoyl reductase (ER) domain-containing protein n=1 Tax=Oleoguttula mirabilis TaxID=1507867 RepID=A0AAV9J929_9PEZI|nr:hypothetical protein LTR36_007984 [Oleoguttula mirabilis]
MATAKVPSTMRAWQYTTTKGGLVPNLKLNDVAVPHPKPEQHLVQILTSALNPVDYKPAEIALFSYFAIPKPATPGVDFAGRIVTPAAGSSLKAGQLVFGVAGITPWAAGALREYSVTELNGTAALPEGLDQKDAATIGVAGLTAYQSIIPHVKPGDHVFINGGSGGTGVFAIQIAKAAGCHVTTSCSTPNVELCKSLGADEVVDYKKQTVLDALRAKGQTIDHVVDNVGSFDLYFQCHKFTKPNAQWIGVGASPSLSIVWQMAKVNLLPGFLGGGKRKYAGFFAESRTDHLAQVAAWMKEGKVKAVVDQQFEFEAVPQAFEKLKTHRARGKIVIDVASEKGGNA